MIYITLQKYTSPLRTVWTHRFCFHPETKCLWIVIHWDNFKQPEAKRISKSRSSSHTELITATASTDNVFLNRSNASHPVSTISSYTGSEIINVHKTKEQREHNKTLFPNPNQNNNGSFVLRHLSPVHESLPRNSREFPKIFSLFIPI